MESDLRGKADFHVHYDDQTALEIIREAAKNKVFVLGLVGRLDVSDHFEEYRVFGGKLGVKVVPGVEYLAKVDETHTDLIALDFDPSHPAILDYFGHNEKRQVKLSREIALKQKRFLEDKGFIVEGKDEGDQVLLQSLLMGEVAEKAIRFCNIVTKNALNRDLIERLKKENSEMWKYVREKYSDRPGYKERLWDLESKFLWLMYFPPGKGGYIPVLTPAEKIIKAVHEARGVALYSPEGSFNENDWDKLIELGIDGIMAWHADKIEVDRKTLINTRSKGLLVLGGSDYNPNLNHWQVGVGQGGMYISARRYLDLKRYKTRNGLQAND